MGQICFDVTAITSGMLKFYFDKPKTVFKVNRHLPPLLCASPFHSLAEMMGGSKIYGHMTIKWYSCQDAGGGSTFPLAHLTPLSPIYELCFEFTNRIL